MCRARTRGGYLTVRDSSVRPVAHAPTRAAFVRARGTRARARRTRDVGEARGSGRETRRATRASEERRDETRRADARWFFRTFELISVNSSRASGRGTWTRDEEVRCRITRMIRARGCG